MILPTIVSISATSINAVPKSYYEGARALGATHEQAVFKVVVPAAKSGILAAVILGIGRAIGETMAVKMVLTNNAEMPDKFLGLFDGFSTLTTQIVSGYNEADDNMRNLLVSVSVVLLIFILLLNISLKMLTRDKKREKQGGKKFGRRTRELAEEKNEDNAG
jgi:phosphate transport system permease protein